MTTKPGLTPGLDCHQHLWPAALQEALRRRVRSPRLVGQLLLLDGEQPFVVDPAEHEPVLRAALAHDDGLAEVLMSLSSPLGIERLDPDEAAPMLQAWHEGAATLGPPFRAWAAAGLVDPDPAALRKVLADPTFVGLQLPACALATPAALEALGPLLAVLDELDRPLLVHPGPTASTTSDAPAWWPALVPYVAQLHAAWHSWHVAGRLAHPRLRVCFVGLAGLAPLHHERLTARGGVMGTLDPHVYYETSSYGTRAVDAMVRVVGVDVLVHGSDRPYATPTDLNLGTALTHAVRSTNPHRLLTGDRSPV